MNSQTSFPMNSPVIRSPRQPDTEEYSFPVMVDCVPVGLNGNISGHQVSSMQFGSLIDLLPTHGGPALLSRPLQDTYYLGGGFSMEEVLHELTHARLTRFIREDEAGLRKGSLALRRGLRVAIAFPTGVEMWVATLYVMCYAIAVPVNLDNTAQELSEEMRGCSVLLVLKGEKRSQSAIAAAKNAGIALVILQKDLADPGLFYTSGWQQQPRASAPRATDGDPVYSPTERADTVLILHTSGTTGRKKRVPYTAEALVVGALCIARSREMRPQETCISLLPLYHVAGISRNLAPALLGGSLAFSGSFDPTFFWRTIETRVVSYFAATPTMLQALLDDGTSLGISSDLSRVRTIESVGGPLAPSLADELAQRFAATIVQGYALTECMPVTCPMYTEALVKRGCVGVSVGPEMAVMDQGRRVATGVQGEVMLRGMPLFSGYCDDDSGLSTFTEEGWFKTGDLGYLDSDGALYITGRSKEVINRAGETLSPAEIEDAIRTMPSVREVMAFATPHGLHQETVGVCVVMREGRLRVSLHAIHAHLADKLHRSKWPQLLVFMEGLPRGPTNKAQRMNFASRCSLPTLQLNTSALDSLFEARRPASGTSVDESIYTERVVISVPEVERALLSVPQVTAAKVWRKTIKGRDALVAFVSPPGIKTDMVEAAMKDTVDSYLVPEFIVPVAALPEDTKELSASTQETLDALFAAQDDGMNMAAEGGMDSFGFRIQRHEMYQIEVKVRDNCYVLFVMGILLDHLAICYEKTAEAKRVCVDIWFTQKWVQDWVKLLGGVKASLGMLMLAGYFHSARGPNLQLYDLAIFALYMFMRWVYPWPFFWLLGGQCHPEKHFSLPRWFLLCVLEARVLIAAVEWFRRRLPHRLSRIADYVNMSIIGMLTILGMCWRNYYDSPYFDLCNANYHSQTTCQVARIFLYRKENLKNFGTVWVWPEMCFFVAYYMFWFLYGRSIVDLFLRIWRRYPQVAAWQDRWNHVAVPAVLVLFLGSSQLYNDHKLNSPYFMEKIEPEQPYFMLDTYSYGRLADMIVYTYHALLGVYLGAKVPFHLKEMGQNTLGVYVCQWGFLALLKNGSFFKTLDDLQSDDYFGKTFFGGSAQLLLIFFVLLWYWMFLGDLTTSYVMLPLKVARSLQATWEGLVAYVRRVAYMGTYG